MLWTLVGFNLILGVLLVHFMKKVIDKVKINYFVHPSEATIDQNLPAEIVEHIMTFLDPLALIECRLVSKYWQYYAVNPLLEKSILDAYDRQMLLTPLPFANDKILNYGPIWMIERKDYPRRFLLRDRALALKHGKKLLEINPDVVRVLLQAFAQDKNLGDNQKIADPDKYIIKTAGYKTGGENTCGIHIDGQNIFFSERSVPGLDWQSIGFLERLDVMFDLNDFFDPIKRTLAQQKVYSVRELNPTKRFGFVPLNHEFLTVMLILFIPLIARDVLHSELLATIKPLFGQLIFLLNLAVNIFMVFELGRYNGRWSSLYKIAAAVFWIGMVAISYLAYPYSLTYYSVVGLMSCILGYTMLLHQYTFHWNAQLTLNRATPALIALALVVVMNDWKWTIDNIKSGAIWFRLFNNTFFYALVCLNCIVLNCFNCMARTERWQWKYLIDWERRAVQTLVQSYAIVVLITLYAPT